MSSINNIILSAASKFIEYVSCFGDNYLLVTQLDAFLRNDVDVDNCALDTMRMASISLGV